jgi:hypothetical protein
MKNKKGLNLNSLLPIALLFVVTGIAIAFGLNILGDVKDDFCSGTVVAGRCYSSYTNTTVNTLSESTEWNATAQAVTGVAKFPAKLGILATVLIAALLIGVLLKYMGGMGNSR